MGVISRLGSTPMKKHPPPISIVRARTLRKNATDAERKMQRLLKEHFPEARFRFQVPIRHYIADFASHRLKIVIELDGGQHDQATDAQREADIRNEGYRIIRFWNNVVLQNGDGCVVRLDQFIAARSPQSSCD
ncbi:MAG: endonuclease domain-containing protein [Novosphingobium sp.]|nr:endonuclease domain-containing protein [Novosphingobium sp.]MBP6555721.1 endonuclease domain-containing protein [Novosphingobium sp.]